MAEQKKRMPIWAIAGILGIALILAFGGVAIIMNLIQNPVQTLLYGLVWIGTFQVSTFLKNKLPSWARLAIIALLGIVLWFFSPLTNQPQIVANLANWAINLFIIVMILDLDFSSLFGRRQLAENE